jgi:hypothetical protein
MSEHSLEQRVADLETKLARSRRLLGALAALPLLLAATAFTQAPGGAGSEIVTRRLTVVDDQGVARVVIGQDAAHGQRRSRAAGITVHDTTGAERGGMGTFEDGSVGLALDAPRGVGPGRVPDRIGMVVGSTGNSQILLTDNESKGVLRMRAAGDGGGGIDFFKWEPETLHLRVLSFDGDQKVARPQNSPKG